MTIINMIEKGDWKGILLKNKLYLEEDNTREAEDWIKVHINIKVARKIYVIVEFYKKLLQEGDVICLYVQHEHSIEHMLGRVKTLNKNAELQIFKDPVLVYFLHNGDIS